MTYKGFEVFSDAAFFDRIAFRQIGKTDFDSSRHVDTVEEAKAIIDHEIETEHLPKNRCEKCIFWRFKGDSENDPIGIGICDNPTRIEQVDIYSEEIMIRLGVDPQIARVISTSLRFHGTFGCVHFQAEIED